jgi:hypothetical protein
VKPEIPPHRHREQAKHTNFLVLRPFNCRTRGLFTKGRVQLFKTANAVTKCYVTAVGVSTKNASLWTRKGKLFPRKGL